MTGEVLNADQRRQKLFPETKLVTLTKQAETRFTWGKASTTLIDIPVTVSPVIAGLIYILVFESRSPLYSVLDKAGIQIVSVPGIILATILLHFHLYQEIILVLESIGSDEEAGVAALRGAKG